MTDSIITVILHALRYFAVGGIVGLIVSIFTIIMILRIAKRTTYYEPTYVPIRLAETKLWQCVFISYPIIFGVGFAIAFMFRA